ncbi:hypothetical protein K461DRAFT_279467 [Myriangium duriaei CBS 260.36]|uniref:Secreted protein n=1 Tax=Myriangium duriaei CBS 260.36 TaxID=1168546 RepID=A0A9P4MF48_9PEZI|nr:hypothetical protein K461DRAFT_279467 [Myriangium duriaei CBS 260.36]
MLMNASWEHAIEACLLCPTLALWTQWGTEAGALRHQHDPHRTITALHHDTRPRSVHCFCIHTWDGDLDYL